MTFNYDKIISKVNSEWLPFFDENKEEFATELIITKMKNKQTVNLFRYYSQYAALMPNELILEKY